MKQYPRTKYQPIISALPDGSFEFRYGDRITHYAHPETLAEDIHKQTGSQAGQEGMPETAHDIRWAYIALNPQDRVMIEEGRKRLLSRQETLPDRLQDEL